MPSLFLVPPGIKRNGQHCRVETSDDCKVFQTPGDPKNRGLQVLSFTTYLSIPPRSQEDLPLLSYPHNKSVSGICGRRPLAPSHGGSIRVIGGTNALPGTWPWMVSIQIPDIEGYKHICGASLISPRWVLTAAHCFMYKQYVELKHMKLVIGATQLSQPGPDVQERTIKNLVEHAQYNNKTVFGDIALMELNKPVNCTDYIQPACLPDSDVDMSTLTHCYVSGWGITDVTRPSQTADVMQEAKVNLIPLDVCNSSDWYNTRIHYNNLCAGYEQGGIDSCQGDSGGPLVCRETRSERFWVVGVTSWGAGCAKARRPGVYSATHLFLDWIKRNTKDKFLSPFRPPGSFTRPQKTTTSTPKPKRKPWKPPISREEIQKFENWHLNRTNTKLFYTESGPWSIQVSIVYSSCRWLSRVTLVDDLTWE
ncbi:acrosin-like [Eublepharis macularius]|uniref:Acrosin n=1 Tax=Eublepharis macularius TaxID=481883 RepID=A0AA97JUH8_EUBMA|nr:acrosin-like [Eublepharis macularius]